MFGELPAWGFYIRHSKGITLKNVKLKLAGSDFRPALIFDDVKGVDLEKVKSPSRLQKGQIILRDVSEFKIDVPQKDLVLNPRCKYQ